MKNLTFHGECGKAWLQVGNRTSHCSGCHETFSSLRAFDMHQRIKDGKNVCLPPASTKPPLVARVCGRTGEPIWGESGSLPDLARGGSDQTEEGRA